MRVRTQLRGFSLLEALFALLLLAFLISAGWAVFVRFLAAGEAVAQRVEALETVRTIAWIISEEVSNGRPAVDWAVPSGDSLLLRAFRNTGLVGKGSGQGGWIQVCSVGLRVPSPGKDSVLVLGKDGRWRTHDLVSRYWVSSGCPGVPGGQEEAWQVSPPPANPILARVFESGSYHFVNGALRYRRGAGGRQPLTPQRIDRGRFIGPPAYGIPLAWEIHLLEDSVGQLQMRGRRSLVWEGRGW